MTEGTLPGGPLSVEAPDRAPMLPAGLAGVRAADAFEVWSATLDPSRLSASATRLLGGRPTPVADSADQLADLDPGRVRSWLAPGSRAMSVELELSLDPGLYGRLRQHAHRDPRLVSALAGGATLQVKVGWLFSKDLRHLSASVLSVRAGGVAFETSGKDVAAWIPELLVELGRRVLVTDPFEPVVGVADRLQAAAVSASSTERSGAVAFRKAIAEPPFSLMDAGVVRDEDGFGLCFGAELLRLRDLGRSAWDIARWLDALWVRRPDVCVIGEPVGAAARERFLAWTEADGAPIEQVWSAPG